MSAIAISTADKPRSDLQKKVAILRALFVTIGGMTTRTLLLVGCLCWPALGQQQANRPAQTGHIANNVVFMQPGDKFGVNLAEAADGVSLSITEEADLKNASLVLSFRQEKKMMLLTIENRIEHWLTYEALCPLERT